jgi:hypothetical protein
MGQALRPSSFIIPYWGLGPDLCGPIQTEVRT